VQVDRKGKRHRKLGRGPWGAGNHKF
jgi:hypothetical protein